MNEYVDSGISLLQFYGWWQLMVCFFAFLGLMAIWFHIGRLQKDYGQVWLAISILCWSASGGVEVFYADEPITNMGAQRDGWRSILSLLNSLFILLSLPWFRYIHQNLEPIIKSKYWPYIVGIPFLFSLLPAITRMISGESLGISIELDVYYATLTLLFLGGILFHSFYRRRLIFLAYLSILCVLITFVAQVMKLIDMDTNMLLFSAVFKTCLIMIFFALALSWVKELSENIFPESENLFLEFKKDKQPSGKYIQSVTFTGLPGRKEREVSLTPGVYDLFYAFAKAKKSENNWLELKPKKDKRSVREYDIQDYNQVKRILISILDGLYGKDNWSKETHMEPLKTTLFETSSQRERKIKLKVPEENITI